MWATIGSGDPTMSGWGHNHELWLVLRARRALRELGDWLVDLPQVVVMPSWIAETVEHVGRSITPTEIDGSLPQVQVFGNLRRCLVEQLPTTARSLRMTAPFLPVWRQRLPRPEMPDIGTRWLIFTEDGDPIGERLQQQLTGQDRSVTVVRTGDRFAAGGDGYRIRPGNTEDLLELFAVLKRRGELPDRVVLPPQQQQPSRPA